MDFDIFLFSLKIVANYISAVWTPAPLIAGAVSLVAAAAICLIAKKTAALKTLRFYVFVFLFAFYAAFILHVTVFSRVNVVNNPLANVFSGWTITTFAGVYDLNPLENIVMFLPFSVLSSFAVSSIKGCKTSNRALLIASCCGFLFSLVIETLQLVTHLGTFQLSDLVYNTLGGFVGAAVVILLRKIFSKLIKQNLKRQNSRSD